MRTTLVLSLQLIRRHFLSIIMFSIVSILVFSTLYRLLIGVDILSAPSQAPPDHWILASTRSSERPSNSIWDASLASTFEELGAVLEVRLTDTVGADRRTTLFIGHADPLMNSHVPDLEAEDIIALGDPSIPGIRDGQVALPWKPSLKARFIAISPDTQVFDRLSQTYQDVGTRIIFVLPWSVMTDLERFEAVMPARMGMAEALQTMILTAPDRSKMADLQTLLPIKFTRHVSTFHFTAMSSENLIMHKAILNGIGYMLFLGLTVLGIFLGMLTFMRNLIDSEIRRFTVQKLLGANERRITAQLLSTFLVTSAIPMLLLMANWMIGLADLRSIDNLALSIRWFAHPMVYFGGAIVIMLIAWVRPILDYRNTPYTELFKTN